MVAGRTLHHQFGRAMPNPIPATGGVGAAVTLTGTCWPNGGTVQVAWGNDQTTPPNITTGPWSATIQADANGNWSFATNYPATAGTYWLWARRANWPHVREPTGPVAVS